MRNNLIGIWCLFLLSTCQTPPAETPGHIGTVLVGEAFVVRDEKVTAVDVDEVMAKVRELQARILQNLEGNDR